MNDPVLFILTVLSILATPGPTNTLLAAGGAVLGVRRGLPLVVAEALGYGIAISIAGLLLKPLLAQFPLITSGVRILVGAYLLLLAWRMFAREDSNAVVRAVVTPNRVFVTTLLNPKAFIFAFVVVPFGKPDAGRYFAAFMCILVAVSVAWLAIGAALGRWATHRGRAHWVSRAGAGVVALFATIVLTTGARGMFDGVRSADKSRLSEGARSSLNCDTSSAREVCNRMNQWAVRCQISSATTRASTRFARRPFEHFGRHSSSLIASPADNLAGSNFQGLTF